MSVQITINVNHAFDGFLYAPLFLASKLGYFPECTKLVFQNGDAACLDALCKHSSSSNEKHWFAICDPFSLDFSAKIPEQGDDIYVVGCLIDKLPVWIYNPDHSIDPVNKEEFLERYKGKLKTLICYKEGTTGYLIGKRLKKLFLKDSNLEEKEFGQEFTSTIANDAAVATSDVLRIVHNGLNDKKIIFNYPMRSPEELKPFLFTAILTLKKEVVSDNLWAVLTLLAGIRRATDLLRQETVSQDCIDILTECFQSKLVAMGVTTPVEQKKLISDTIIYAFQATKLYSENLYPDKKAWDNAKKQWEEITGKQFVDAEERHDPIPALLIKSGWRKNADLRNHINDGFPNLGTVLASDALKWYHKLSPVLLVILAISSLTALLTSCHSAAKPFADNLSYIIPAVVAFLIQVGFTVKLCWDLLRLETKSYVICLTTAIGVGLAIFYTAIGMIK